MYKNKSGFYQVNVDLTEVQKAQLRDLDNLLDKEKGNCSLIAQVFPDESEMYVIYLPNRIAQKVHDILAEVKQGTPE